MEALLTISMHWPDPIALWSVWVGGFSQLVGGIVSFDMSVIGAGDATCSCHVSWKIVSVMVILS